MAGTTKRRACSDACRMKAYRRRKKAALKGEGGETA
jgi:hypothetical protein